MAELRKEESEVAIKSCAERFFDAYRNKPTLFPKMCPNLVKDIQQIKGDSMSVGSVFNWTYVPVGHSSSPDTFTILIDAIDETSKSITFKVIDGDMIKKLYSHYKFTIQAINSPDGNGSFVKSTLEYEKVNPNVPDPDLKMYFDTAAMFYKGIDAVLVN